MRRLFPSPVSEIPTVSYWTVTVHFSGGAFSVAELAEIEW